MRLFRVIYSIIALFLVLASPLNALAATPTPTFEEGWYIVRYVVDGDTIYVEGLNQSIRFAGIDAPEISTIYGPLAKDTTYWLLHQSQHPGWVYLQPADPPFDTYTNRYRAHVWFYDINWGGWILVQEYLVQAGLAHVDHGQFTSDLYYDALAQAENSAYIRGCGIWGGRRC